MLQWKLFINDEKCFNFIVKTLFILKILKVCLGFLSDVGKLLDKKLEIHFNIYDLIDWETYNYNTYILANISRSKVNQTAKVGPLKGVFFYTLYTKRDREATPRPFSKNSKLSISLE